MQSMVRGGVGHRHTIPTCTALTALVALVGAMLLSTPASAAAATGGCDPVVVHTPTSSEGDASAVTIDSQVLGAGGSAWERVSWTVADGTALSAVEVVSPDGETVTRTGDIAVGFEEDVAELRFCAAASGTGAAGSDDPDDASRPADRGDDDAPAQDGAEAGDGQETPGGGSDGQDGRAGHDEGTASSGQPAGDERPDEPSGSAAGDPSQPASDGDGTAAQDDGAEAGEPDPDEAADQQASAADARSTEPADGEADALGQAAGQPAGAESSDSAALPMLAIGLLLGTAVLLAVAWRQRSA